jgi:hypothetical protein
MNWKRTLWSWVTVIALLVMVLWQEAMYVTSESITVAWDRSTEGSDPESYRVVAAWEGSGGLRQEFDLGLTSELSKTVEFFRAGVFSFKIRAERGTEVSPWAVSTNPEQATVDGLPRGWRVLFELPAPGGGGIGSKGSRQL